MSALVELEHVRKKLGGRPVLADVNLAVREGEVVGLLGPSGVGKSTLLRMIAGLEIPDSGRVRVRSTRIGYVFQESRLLPWDTVLHNVALPLLALGLGRREAMECAGDYLSHMELAEFGRCYPRELSGGMRQRVALARAFAVSPDVLLLDEPFTGLDNRLKESMGRFLESALEAKNIAVVHVTHDPSELRRRSTRVVELDRGECGACLAEGCPRDDGR